MPRRRRVRVDQIRVIFLVPGMELEDQVTVIKHPIVAIAMLVLRERIDSQELSVPAAACPYVAHGNQRLRPNAGSSPGLAKLFLHLVPLT
jgi:hypothetical protein